ncbi:unnamed protein product, partial [Pylaiella littoralis]
GPAGKRKWSVLLLHNGYTGNEDTAVPAAAAVELRTTDRVGETFARMYVMRSAARVSLNSRQGVSHSTARFRGIPRGSSSSPFVGAAAGAGSVVSVGVPTARGVSSSRSRVVFLSALATLGASSASSASAFSASASASTFSRSALTMTGVRLLATSAASTLVISLVMPQRVLCASSRGEDEDDDRDGKGKVNGLLRIARGVFLGDENDADGKRRPRSGKDRHESGDDTENAKKLVQDLTDAFNGFGEDLTKAVDGAVKRKNKPAEPASLGDAVRKKLNELLESGAPTQISFGFSMGVCCGFAAKKTAKVALVGVGLAFGSLQLLSYMGYLELDYTKIEDEMMTALDIDKSGKVDADDVQELWNRAQVLSHNLPAGSGFVAGAIIGARMG